MWTNLLFCLLLFSLAELTQESRHNHEKAKSLRSCYSLSKFQYQCDRMEIDPSTQQPITCQPDNSVIRNCFVIPGIDCDGLVNGSNFFELRVPDGCDYNSHLSFSKALLLSIFFGFLGIDRIYLGYYAVGLFKMFTLGGLFIFWLTDVVLISLQILLPADGTSYRMNYYGPKATALRFEPIYTNYSVLACIDCI